MSHCRLELSTNSLLVISTGSSARPISSRPASLLSPIFCPPSPHTLNSSHREGPVVPRTYLVELMSSWGSFSHSFNSVHGLHLNQASVSSRTVSLISSFFHPHLICHLSETFFKPLKPNKVPLFYILCVGDSRG